MRSRETCIFAQHQTRQQHQNSWRRNKQSTANEWTYQCHVGLLGQNAIQILRVLRAHGLSQDCLEQVFCSTVLAKLLYASPAWSGFCSAADVNKPNIFIQMQKNCITANNLLLALLNCFNLLTSPSALLSNPIVYIYSTPFSRQNHLNHITFDPAVTISQAY